MTDTTSEPRDSVRDGLRARVKELERALAGRVGAARPTADEVEAARKINVQRRLYGYTSETLICASALLRIAGEQEQGAGSEPSSGATGRAGQDPGGPPPASPPPSAAQSAPAEPTTEELQAMSVRYDLSLAIDALERIGRGSEPFAAAYARNVARDLKAPPPGGDPALYQHCAFHPVPAESPPARREREGCYAIECSAVAEFICTGRWDHGDEKILLCSEHARAHKGHKGLGRWPNASEPAPAPPPSEDEGAAGHEETKARLAEVERERDGLPTIHERVAALEARLGLDDEASRDDLDRDLYEHKEEVARLHDLLRGGAAAILAGEAAAKRERGLRVVAIDLERSFRNSAESLLIAEGSPSPSALSDTFRNIADRLAAALSPPSPNVAEIASEAAGGGA